MREGGRRTGLVGDLGFGLTNPVADGWLIFMGAGAGVLVLTVESGLDMAPESFVGATGFLVV